ncbi:zinc-ribbon domain-containing protein [Cytobacillus firmus]|uniref:Treble clef zinc finger domain-containing protein n=1 Tax=Cytobacillus firmus DS1 TaxID=1307436 RepID=W7LIT9_CYTFI|nr:hypothetical protein [Cytobacillus firmus]EWG12024.1 hypothetical protein PBF_04493 [Cytobacillus firmus DS1]
MAKLTILDMKKMAAEKGGFCLSEEYINNLTKLTWKCSEGHIWDTIPKHIRKGAWCPICARKKENRKSYGKVTIDDMRIIAEEKQGSCLSKEYSNKSTKLKFQCINGHIFESRPAEILRRNWCAYCAGKYKNNIVKMQEVAQKFGGKCLSSKYINVFTKLRWQCANGHEFEAIPKHVLNGHWCPNCTFYLNEQRCRFIFECLFNTKFLKDHTALDGLELDGYNPELKLAFEYHGKQHYEEIGHFYSRGDMTLEDRMKRDKFKEEKCKELGIELIIIPYTIKSMDQVSFIVLELEKRGYSFQNDPESIDFSKFLPMKESLKEIQEIAKSQGGRCLSIEYINVDTEMEFECANGHRFFNTPYRIKKGNWCRKCFYIEKAGSTQRLDSNIMQELANKYGWQCLSHEYKNAREKLKWKCGKGHIFERSVSHVKEGRGCPECGKLR